MQITKEATQDQEIRGRILWLCILLLAITIGLLGAGGFGRLALIICAYIALAALWGRRPETLALCWLALSPVASYFLRYPLEKSLLTFDRALVVILMLAVAARIAREQEWELPVGAFELCWLLFSGYALADCLSRGEASPASLKIVIDAFLLPLALFIVARNGLAIVSMKTGVLVALTVLAYLLFPIGLYELLTGVDLLRYPGADLQRDGIIRPNGPFLSDNSYALISLLVGLALLFWPEVAGLRITGRLRLLWWGGVVSALLAALVPQFRAVGLAMVGSLALSRLLRHGWRALVKPALAAGLIVMACLPIWLMARATDFYQRRLADPTNAYSRLATYKIALAVTREQWPMGVGFGRYEEYFQRHFAPKEIRFSQEELRRLPQSTPHNNLLSVVAELGVIGFVLYVLANLMLLRAGLRLWRRQGRARAAGAAVVTLWTAYTGVGLTLTSGYYSDLNLTFLFLVGVLINCGGEENEKN